MRHLIENKISKEKAEIKGREIAKLDFRGEHIDEKTKIKIDIVSINAITGGVEVFARAWKGGKQLGFGKDGSIEIERFRIFNPPVLVSDDNGDIVRIGKDINGKITERKLREDPAEAIRQVIAHNASLVGKEGTNIIKGKIGNTTSTFYPDPNVESTSVDGLVRGTTVNQTWAAKIAETGSDAFDALTGDASILMTSGGTTNQWNELRRGIFIFDTSAIADTDTIDSGTFSLASALIAGATKADNLSITPDTALVSSAPASNTALVAGDFDSLGTTEFATRISYANWSASDAVYNDFTLNASGLSNISKTGVSKFGVRNGNYDLDAVAPTWSGSVSSFMRHYYADQTGTANDPKLVVVHSAAAATFTPQIIII